MRSILERFAFFRVVPLSNTVTTCHWTLILSVLAGSHMGLDGNLQIKYLSCPTFRMDTPDM